MKITILTLFPNMFKGFLTESILSRAQKERLIDIEIVNLRKWGIGKHRSVDDTPYGGGAGMVLKVNVVVDALRSLTSNDKLQMTNNKQIRNSKLETRNSRIILLTPQGKLFKQQTAKRLAGGKEDLILVCGHYEGFDERIRDYVDEEISIGDYVLTGGELAAAVVTDTIVRLLPGVLGKDESSEHESFSYEIESSVIHPRGSAPKSASISVLEYPQYTRPKDFGGKKVPEILKSGNHAKIAKWRKEQAIKRTKKRRPDLIDK